MSFSCNCYIHCYIHSYTHVLCHSNNESVLYPSMAENIIYHKTTSLPHRIQFLFFSSATQYLSQFMLHGSSSYVDHLIYPLMAKYNDLFLLPLAYTAGLNHFPVSVSVSIPPLPPFAQTTLSRWRQKLTCTAICCCWARRRRFLSCSDTSSSSESSTRPYFEKCFTLKQIRNGITQVKQGRNILELNTRWRPSKTKNHCNLPKNAKEELCHNLSDTDKPTKTFVELYIIYDLT